MDGALFGIRSLLEDWSLEVNFELRLRSVSSAVQIFIIRRGLWRERRVSRFLCLHEKVCLGDPRITIVQDTRSICRLLNHSKTGAKPQSSPGSKDLGRTDPEALDELEEVEAKLYQQETGISIYVSSEETERDDDETTKAGQSSACKAGEILCVRRSSRSDFIIRSMATL